MSDVGTDPEQGDWGQATFAANRNAAAAARRALSRLVDGVQLPPDCYSDLELLVSELITNAVTHTDSDTVELRVRTGDPIRVCVVDGGKGGPELREAEVGGWGLRLVDALACDWGVVSLPTGKAVWFELPIVS